MVAISRSTSTSSKTNGHVCSYQQPDWDDVLHVPKLSFSVASVLVFCLAVLCFANTINGDFVYDDISAITTNKDVLPEIPPSALFAHDFWGKAMDNRSHKSYRPLTVMTFRWNYAWADGLHPRGFHVVNIVLHGLVSVIFLAVFSVLMSGYQVDQESARPVFASPRAALLCSVLFAVHPIHTESVAGVVGRADLLCALTFLLSFLLYARACLSPSCLVSYRPKSFSLVSILASMCLCVVSWIFLISASCSVSYRPESFSLVFILASMCLCVVSTFCKEQGITVIGICSVFDIVTVCRLHPLQCLAIKKSKTCTDNGHCEFNNNHVGHTLEIPLWVKGLITRHLILFVTGVSILITRLWIMGSTPPTFRQDENPHSFFGGILYRVLNYNYLYAINSWLLLNPWWLCFDWSMGSIPVITSLADPRILADIGLWAVFGALVFQCCRGGLTRDNRILITSMAVLGVPFLPASNLFFRVGFVIAERILYLSCAGFCMLVVLGARQICHKCQPNSTAKMMASAGFTFVIVTFVLRSIQRSGDWKVAKDLYQSGVSVCPLNAKIQFNIAKLEEQTNPEYAIEKYRLALKLNPEYAYAMNNLAIILKERGDLGEAERLLEDAVSVRADFAAAWTNLGVVRAALKKTETAEASYLEAIRHERKHSKAHFNLGNLYRDTGRPIEALSAWREAVEYTPTCASAWRNTVLLLHQLGRQNVAIATGQQALKVVKNDPKLMLILANIYLQALRFPESERLFLDAIKLDQQNVMLYKNLGVLYQQWGKNAKANAVYRKVELLASRKQ
ncbi:protein O-mannosyl-transferase TMTC4-like [Haliotis rubra]|uniref:protein O-mannosyl-transferase TMTC4-like n=1 Tax=Haliotis rubra TaxID=36100 RepID=UPI001EE5E361|nr:protein O-mannosyl-transferase TMTC4-like [Haliotis rubra]